jgi:hypothetical protein
MSMESAIKELKIADLYNQIDIIDEKLEQTHNKFNIKYEITPRNDEDHCKLYSTIFPSCDLELYSKISKVVYEHLLQDRQILEDRKNKLFKEIADLK